MKKSMMSRKLVKRAVVKRKENGARPETAPQYGPEVCYFFITGEPRGKRETREKSGRLELTRVHCCFSVDRVINCLIKL